MKNSLCICALLILAFASCKKTETPHPNGTPMPSHSDPVYNIGDIYQNDTLKGVVFYTYGDHNGLMVSLQEACLPWCVTNYINIETGATNPYDGWNNTNIVMANHDLYYYPAINWTYKKNTWHLIHYEQQLITHRQWYVPSTSELRHLLMNQAAVNATLDSLGYPTLEDKTYWSSTETGTRGAAAVRLQNGEIVIDDSVKDQVFYVRAIRNY